VNPLGAFFYKNFLRAPNTTDSGRIRGGSFQAQAFISLHELGHGTDVLEHDAGIPAAGGRNDDKIDKNCKKTIKAAKQ